MMMSKMVFGVSCAMAAGLMTSAALGQQYTATVIPTLGGASNAAYGVNEAGWVVGQSDTFDGPFHAFVYINGVVTDLGTLEGGSHSTAFGINNNGVIVGRADNASGTDRPVRWTRDQNGQWQIEDLGTLRANGFGFGWALRVNDAGQVVGYATSANTNAYHAFRLTGTTKLDLGTLAFGGNFAYSQGLAINSAGKTSGFAYMTLGGPEHGFLHDGDMQHDVTPPGQFGLADWYGINDNDQLAGYVSSTETGGAFRSARAVRGNRDNVIELIPTLDGTTDGYGYDINNAGDVVGTSFLPQTGGSLFKAFAYVGGQVVDLTTASTGLNGMALMEGRDISNNGMIAAIAEADPLFGTTAAVLLRPGTPCVADVAGLGGAAGADGQLTADDIVFYLGAFFAADLSVADIAGLGGATGADGQLTPDDLIAFLGSFFGGCQ